MELKPMNLIEERIKDSIDTKKKILQERTFIEQIFIIAEQVYHSLKSGGKILICGNGGSASDSLHMAGEIVGRFQKERNGWPAVALNADVASMTAIANDYGYDNIFSRAVEAYMKSNDTLIGISSSGNSENVLQAVKQAKRIGGKTVLLAGKKGGKIIKEVDYSFIVPSDVTARIQESHIMAIHIICELVEEMMTDE